MVKRRIRLIDHQKLYQLQAQMCKVFTSSKRLEILNLLKEKELSVGQLVHFLNIRQVNLSQHLTLLRERGVVKTRRNWNSLFSTLEALSNSLTSQEKCFLKKCPKIEDYFNEWLKGDDF